jgi:hypothetical protein
VSTLSNADLGAITWSFGIYVKETQTAKEFAALFQQLSKRVIQRVYPPFIFLFGGIIIIIIFIILVFILTLC